MNGSWIAFHPFPTAGSTIAGPGRPDVHNRWIVGLALDADQAN